VILKLLARTPAERYGSAAEVRDAWSGVHARRVSSDGTALPRKETPRSAATVTFDAPTPVQTAPAKVGMRTPVVRTPTIAAAPSRRRWLWPLALVALVAIVWSSYARISREGREQRFAQARADSARRADSLRKADSARADSVSNAMLVGGMVDSARLAEQARRDSAANIRNVLRNGVVAAITRYTSAIQRGDLAAARTAFPGVAQEELTRWQGLLERYDLRFRVVPPQRVDLSDRDLVADADVDIVMESIDRTTKERTTSRLLRHATLTKQRQSWQLDVLRQR
jgi:hypothetical protein